MNKLKTDAQLLQADVTGSPSLKLNKGVMTFRVDTMGLLTEIAECGLPRTQGILKVPLNIFKNLLADVAQRAIELDDPQLNILMLSLNLYEVPHSQIYKQIEKQQKRKK